MANGTKANKVEVVKNLELLSPDCPFVFRMTLDMFN